MKFSNKDYLAGYWDAINVMAEAVRAREAAKPEPREPDAIMLCHRNGDIDWDNVHPPEYQPSPLRTPSWPTRKVYLDTPPAPAKGTERDWLGKQVKTVAAEQAAKPEHKRVPSLRREPAKPPLLKSRALDWEAYGDDTPAMVEARRLIAEGWEPGRHDETGLWVENGRRSERVGKAVVDAMRALRGGK